ncbi:MAG: trigger factor [Bacteroidetes bacterium]|nr:trigger factor [Bacteroidota bacterium]MBP6314882.1 trigger factor [Chitinophagaceae bacterium]
MATVSQQNIGLQHEKITIQLSTEDYLPSVQKTLRKLSKDAAIPGFRKGMVPLGHIKKLYGQSVYSDEVLKAAGTKLEEHLVSTKAEIFARPVPAESQTQYDFNIDNPENYTFEFEIGTKPNFEIPLLQNASTLPTYKVTISNEMMQEEIEKLQLKAGDLSEIDTVASEENVLHILIQEKDENGNLIPGGVDTKHALLLKYFSKNTRNTLLNKKVQEHITSRIDQLFDEAYGDSILNDLKLGASLDKEVVVGIEKIEHIAKAELGQAMFEKIYPGKEIDTEEKFRSVLLQEMQTYWNGHSRNYLQNDIFERLVHETPITLPTSFLKRWMSIGGEKYTPMEVVEKEFGKFEHQLRWQLISDKIIEENKLEVRTEEMEQAARMQIMSYFGQYGSMPEMDASWMEPVVKKQLADKKFADELYNRIITDKLFYTIENGLHLQETEISKDDFLAMINKPHHHHQH